MPPEITILDAHVIRSRRRTVPYSRTIGTKYATAVREQYDLWYGWAAQYGVRHGCRSILGTSTARTSTVAFRKKNAPSFLGSEKRENPHISKVHTKGVSRFDFEHFFIKGCFVFNANLCCIVYVYALWFRGIYKVVVRFLSSMHTSFAAGAVPKYRYEIRYG